MRTGIQSKHNSIQKSRSASKEDEKSRASNLNSQIFSSHGQLTAMEQRRLNYQSKANVLSRMLESDNAIQNDMIDGSLGSVMYTSEISQRMRHGRSMKSRLSNNQNFGRILCNNISEAASFVYDTMADVTVQSSIGDNHIAPAGEIDHRMFVS